MTNDFFQNNKIENFESFLTLLAVKSAEATRGGLPSDDNNNSITSTTETAAVESEIAILGTDELAKADSSNSISCWDALSVIDRAECENSGILTPGCPQSQICKRVDDTCGYVCENPIETPKPCADDGHIGKSRNVFSVHGSGFIII